MSTTTGSNRSFADSFGEKSKTAVSRYDLVSGFLVAAVVLLGFIVGLMALLFFLNMEWEKKPTAEMFVFDDLAGFENPEGIAEDFEEPGVEELADVEEPQLADALEMVTDAVSTTRAALEAVDGTAAQMGTGKGLGDKRQSGAGGGGTGKGNPFEKWVVQYSTKSKSQYASQLDYFGVEIGSLSKTSSLIEYASKLTGAKPVLKKGTRKDEKRVLFKKPDNSPLTRWDKQFLTKAGAQTNNRLILNFYPEKTKQLLLARQKARLQKDQKQFDDVKRCVFIVQSTGGKFDFMIPPGSAGITYY